MYTLNKNELSVFRATFLGHMSISDLRDAAGVSNISAYRLVQSLASKRLIVVRREGKKSVISPSSHGHAKALAAYLEGSRRTFAPLLGSRLLVMLSVSSRPKDLARIAEEVRLSRETVRRVVWSLRSCGAVSQDRLMVSVPEPDSTLVRFLRDFSKGACSAVLEDKAATGTVLWSEGLEFVFTARRVDDASGVRETGITAMSRRGLEFVSDTRYYHCAYWQPRLRPEDIALHNVLADPADVRGMSYSLLFLMKRGYSRRYLVDLGTAVGIGDLAEKMAAYLKGMAVDDPRLPDRDDMDELRVQYGVG